MKRPGPTTVRRLFAVAGNRCCHPNCTSFLIGPDGTSLAEICHIRARSEGGARFDPHQTDSERHAFENLLLLCPSHHRLVDALPETYTVAVLTDMKTSHELRFAQAETEGSDPSAKRLENPSRGIDARGNRGTIVVGSEGTIVAGVVRIGRGTRKPAILAPPGTIGAAAAELRYVEYLIGRYNEYASADRSRGTRFCHGAIRTNIESMYGARVQMLPISRFEELCVYLQGRIARTRIAKTNHSRGHRSFSTYAEHASKVGGR